MSIQACAESVQRGDPDRFLATMAAPRDARTVLFAIYAFNLEVARAPWVTNEPLIAEMRLQFWRDVLDQISTKQPVSDHEVAVELARVLPAAAVPLLDDLVQARRRDIGGEPFASQFELDAYLADTSGTLMAATAMALGADDQTDIRTIGAVSGLANWCLAAPDLLARGRVPFVDDSPNAIRDLAHAGLASLRTAGSVSSLSRPARIAALSGWRAHAILTTVARHPDKVLSGIGLQSEFARRGSLMLHSLTLR